MRSRLLCNGPAPCRLLLQWGTRQLPVPPPGCVRVLWCAASVSGPHALPPETRQAVEGVAALAASKLATRRQGWHIEVVPSEEFYCGTAHRCIVVSTAAIATCFGRHGTTSGCSQGGAAVEERPEAALLFLLGHEMAHGMQRHAVRRV